MNENHQRHLFSIFQYVDNLLREAEQIMATAGSNSPFEEYSQDSTPGQRQAFHHHVVAVQTIMSRVVKELNIPLHEPKCSATWAARNHVSFADIAIVEIKPERMKGYGDLSEVDARLLSQIAAELTGSLARLERALTCKGPSDSLVLPETK